MNDVYVAYQAHRAKYADMKEQMWVVSWHNYMDTNNVSRGRNFGTFEQAVAYAKERLGGSWGFIHIKNEDGSNHVIEVM